MTCGKCQVTGELIAGHSRIILCEDCEREKQRQAIVVSYQNTKRHKYKVNGQSMETPTKQDETLMKYPHWVAHQRELMTDLARVQRRELDRSAVDYLGRLCDVCGGTVAKYAKLPLCKEHQRAHARFMMMMRKRRQRKYVTI